MAKAPAPFRFAGVLTLVVLGALALTGALASQLGLYRRPEPGVGDPRWEGARAYVTAHPGTHLAICRAPADFRRAGRLRVGDATAPSFWDGDRLVQVVPEPRGGAPLVSEAGVEGWASWRGDGCAWVRATTLRLDGQRLDVTGVPAGGGVRGCGLEVQAAADGSFSLVIGPEALELANEGERGPVCHLDAGGARTEVDLAPGGARRVVVQAGVSP